MNKLSLTLVTIIVGALLVLVFLQMEKPAFEMKTELLVVPKNEIISNDMNHIIHNIAKIASEQEKSEEISNKRAVVNIERLNEGSIIQIIVLAQNSQDTKTISEQIVFNLLKDISTHYNTKTDININLAKKTESEASQWSSILPIIFWGLIGVLLSILVVMIVELFTHKNKSVSQNKLRNVDNDKVRSLIDQKGSSPVYDLQIPNQSLEKTAMFQNRVAIENMDDVQDNQSVNSESVEISKKDKIKDNIIDDELKVNSQNIIQEENENNDISSEPIIKQVEKKQINEKIDSNNKSGAPSNLPIAGLGGVDDLIQDDKKMNENKFEADVKKINDNEEPTEDELKARLNKLLQGEL